MSEASSSTILKMLNTEIPRRDVWAADLDY